MLYFVFLKHFFLFFLVGRCRSEGTVLEETFGRPQDRGALAPRRNSEFPPYGRITLY